MKRPEPVIYFKGSLVPHVRSLIDEPTMRGACGVCRVEVGFTQVDGQWVPKSHPAPKPVKRRKTKALPSGRVRGRSMSRR